MRSLGIALCIALLATPALAARKKAHRSPPQQRYIACTVLGCYPAPPGCYPTMGYTFDGIPTGYDVIVCPRRR